MDDRPELFEVLEHQIVTNKRFQTLKNLFEQYVSLILGSETIQDAKRERKVGHLNDFIAK